MKTRIIAAALVLAAIAPVALWVGVVAECEYPYAITIFRAAHAKAANGTPAASAISQALGVQASKLDWHRCSFCANFDGELPDSMVRVQVSIVPRDNYVFAFDAQRGILYSADVKTASAFPEMTAVASTERGTNGTRTTRRSLPSGARGRALEGSST